MIIYYLKLQQKNHFSQLDDLSGQCLYIVNFIHFIVGKVYSTPISNPNLPLTYPLSQKIRHIPQPDQYLSPSLNIYNQCYLLSHSYYPSHACHSPAIHIQPSTISHSIHIIVGRGCPSPTLKKSSLSFSLNPPVVWNHQLPLKAIFQEKNSRAINNYVFNYNRSEY